MIRRVAAVVVLCIAIMVGGAGIGDARTDPAPRPSKKPATWICIWIDDIGGYCA